MLIKLSQCVVVLCVVCHCSATELPPDEVLDGATCNVGMIEEANTLQLFSILNELVNTTYFRLFRVELDRQCFRDATVEPSCGNDFPDPLEAQEPAKCDLKGGSTETPFSTFESLVDKRLSSKEEESVKEEESCDPNLPEFWQDMCSNIPTDSHDYVNLLLNPESFTGYNGNQVWERVYNENCLRDGSTVDTLCYEQRVLYRLLSGMHASINLHISDAFYPPSKSKGTTAWAPNLDRYVKQFKGNPDYIRNLRFSFVVLLRSLMKAAPVLEKATITGTDADETARTKVLLRRLLDSKVMSTCSSLFEAFDESLLFKEADGTSTRQSLKRQFKEVFKNVSAELDCISCQKCKLHGKLALMGIGTALKVLLVPESVLQKTFLSHEEVVALINTVAKMSSALKVLKNFDDLEKQAERNARQERAAPVPLASGTIDFELLDTTVGKLAAHVAPGSSHDKILDKVLAKDHSLLALGRHYNGPDFARHALRHITGDGDASLFDTDVVVIGGGLAGLTASLVLLDKGHRVTMVEKEAFIGGNSAKASSGINGVLVARDLTHDGDTEDKYREDVMRSGGFETSFPMLDAFIKGAGEAVMFLRERVGMDLDKVVQMGGHEKPRTYRPTHGMAGAEITMSINAMIDKYAKDKSFVIMKKTRATELVMKDGQIEGVVVEGKDGKKTIRARNVVLGTGGYALGGEGTFLAKYRPDLAAFATTNGKWCTGDGHRMAEKLDAQLIDMQNIQVHPTGFIDPSHPDAVTKTLSAELLRGMGGIMLLQNGTRFVDELGTRAHVSSTMLQASPMNLSFTLVVHEGAAVHADKHIPIYSQKGLLKHLGVEESVLRVTMEEYNRDAVNGVDRFGKTHFNNVPVDLGGHFYAGLVTPVLHYSMGGLKIDDHARVLGKDGNVIEGLYAAGEVTGGLHGRNRLGGNALTECVVFGKLAAEHIASKGKATASQAPSQAAEEKPLDPTKRLITKEELAQHSSETDLWIALHGKVYDLTDFVEEHPAGPDAITKLAGTDGTKVFSDAHSEATLAVFTPIGILKE